MARLPEHRFSEETKLKCKERARFTCEYCGAKDVPLEIHHILSLWFIKEMNKTAGYEVFAPALVTSLANAKALCPTCHIKEFHNPKTETRQSYIDQVGLVMQAYLTAMTDPSLDDWRTDLVQSANNNYYKPKPRRKRAKKRK